MPITPEQVTALVEPLVAGNGFDLEDVGVSRAGQRSTVTVVVDRDGGDELDSIADLSRAISARLDDDPDLGSAIYTLEVTSPGVERTISAPRHWRRVLGRKVEVTLDAGAGGRHIVGRAGPLVDDTSVRIVTGDRRGVHTEDIALDSIASARGQVEFGRPNAAELAACGLGADEIARRRRSDAPTPAASADPHTSDIHTANTTESDK